MAPRPLESFEQFKKRLIEAIASEASELRFGGSHYTHAVCREAQGLSLRKLGASTEQIKEAFGERPFTPEQLEEIQQPLLVELPATSLELLLTHIKARWHRGTLLPIDTAP